MLTRQGVIATAVAVSLVVAGRLFGIFELFLLGAGGAALVVAAVAATGLTRLRLDVSRELRPDRLHAGTPGVVELRVSNRGNHRTPLLHLRDSVGETGRVASVVLSPLASGEQVGASYSLPSDRRGRLAVGPLEVRVCDPFGLASLSTPAAPRTTLTIWPAVDEVLAPSSVAGQRYDAGDPCGLAVSGEELYALRPYVDGDDLRRVHWRASAKRDDLVVRQDERPGQGQVTVVLDVRIGAYGDDGRRDGGGDTFERAVSAAASILVSSARRGLLVRLVTTAGHDSGLGGTGRGASRGQDHLDAILEHLAVVQERNLGHLTTLVSTVDRPGASPGGPVVVVTGASSAGGGPGVPLDAGTTSPRVILVNFTAGGPIAAAQAGIRSVVVDHATPFAMAWNQAMASATWAAAGVSS